MDSCIQTRHKNLEMQSICRICFGKGDINLFTVRDETEDYPNIINECFQITVPYDKNKPCAICKNCVSELNLANSLRLKCLTIEDRFVNYCKQLLLKHTLKEQESNLYYDENIDNCFDNPESTNENCLFIRNELEILSENVTESNKNASNFKCSMCFKILKSKASLLSHHESMHVNRKHIGKVSGFGAARTYHCTTCSYSTPHSQTLVNHMRRHNGERPYTCECGKSFTQSSSLAAHRKTHSTTTFFTCSLCGKQFKHAFVLKNHSRVHENGSFSCSVCYKTLKSKQSLQAHMRRHYNICNFNCEDCGDTFVTSSELLNHRKKHSSEKKIECHLCGYKTHTKKNLIMHLKRHTGNRCYKCTVCQVAFYTQSNLQRHQRVHTRDKPFACPTCSQKFTYSPSLNKHMKTVHGIDYKWADFKWKDTKIVKVTVKTDDVLTTNV